MSEQQQQQRDLLGYVLMTFPGLLVFPGAANKWKRKVTPRSK